MRVDLPEAFVDARYEPDLFPALSTPFRWPRLDAFSACSN